MTNRLEDAPARRLACSGCGAEFGCNPQGGCWCADEDFRLPMPTDESDCLCPECLRNLAKTQQGSAAK